MAQHLSRRLTTASTSTNRPRTTRVPSIWDTVPLVATTVSVPSTWLITFSLNDLGIDVHKGLNFGDTTKLLKLETYYHDPEERRAIKSSIAVRP
jgi:hypothetical protein